MLLPENIKFSYDNLNASYFNCTYHFLFMMHNLRRGLVHCSPTFWVNNIHRKRMDFKIIIFLWNKWEGPLLLQTRVWPTTQGNGIFKTESALNSRHRDKLLKEKNVTITAHQQRRITKINARIHELMYHTYLCLIYQEHISCKYIWITPKRIAQKRAWFSH